MRGYIMIFNLIMLIVFRILVFLQNFFKNLPIIHILENKKNNPRTLLVLLLIKTYIHPRIYLVLLCHIPTHFSRTYPRIYLVLHYHVPTHFSHNIVYKYISYISGLRPFMVGDTLEKTSKK